MKQPAVYIMANRRNGTLYTGVTSDLLQRVHQHRSRLMPGFSSRYGCTLLVWYERHDEMPAAIAREKQIKAGSRRRKLALIEEMNRAWRDLYHDLTRKRASPHFLRPRARYPSRLPQASAIASAQPRHRERPTAVIASAAKQSRTPAPECWIASSLRSSQ